MRFEVLLYSRLHYVLGHLQATNPNRMSVPVVRIAGGAGDLSSSTRAVTIFPSGPVWRLSRPCDSSRVAVWLMDWRPAYVESLREDVVVERTVLDRLKRRSAMVGIRTSRRT